MKQNQKQKVSAEFAKSRVRVEKRQVEADQRAEKRAKRTAKQQVARLDKLLGKGKGAVKERARLAKEMSE